MKIDIYITIKGDDSTLRKKFEVSQPILMSPDCPELREMIEKSKAEFQDPIDDVIVKMVAIW